jgi:predicted signal transduction protein with EAL and GGDEF domain
VHVPNRSEAELQRSAAALCAVPVVHSGDAEATVQTLQQLKTLSVQLAIDDFDTGYSGLPASSRSPSTCSRSTAPSSRA